MSHIQNKITQDYEDLFSGKRSGHLTEYAYEGHDYFGDLVHKNKDYYLFYKESQILKNNAAAISKILGPNINVCEIGPGPEDSLKEKVVPVIAALDNPTSYTAIDIKDEYSIHARDFIQSQFPELNTHAKCIDFSDVQKLCCSGKTCLLFLGSTISNFDDKEINKMCKVFKKILSVGDYIVITFDCTQDIEKLKKAYFNFWASQLILNVLRFFKTHFDISDFNLENFDTNFNINNKTFTVNMDVVSKCDQSFVFNGRKIFIPRNKKYRLIKSRKFTTSCIEKLITKQNLDIVDSFSCDTNDLFVYVLQIKH